MVRSTVEQEIQSILKQQNIEEVTIIGGVRVYYSDTYKKYFADCNSDLIDEFMEDLLAREVLYSSIFANRKLYIFIDPSEEDLEPLNEYYCNNCGREFSEQEGKVPYSGLKRVRCPGCGARWYEEEGNDIVEMQRWRW